MHFITTGTLFSDTVWVNRGETDSAEGDRVREEL